MATFRNSIAAMNSTVTTTLETFNGLVKSTGNATKLLTNYVDVHLAKQQDNNKVELGTYRLELKAATGLRIEAVKEQLRSYHNQESLQESLDQVQAMLDS